MNLVGSSLLHDLAGRRPEAAPHLKALHALIRRADWSGPADVESQFPAAARADGDGRVTLYLEDCGLRVVLRVNYEIKLVRIVSASTNGGPGGDASQ
jgi:mRNA-degrading endonuclease HigB of HigAB toxin-antitoxin module